ncbi:glycosyltransferase family 2 protein [Thioalkalivibrio sp. AKL10]|uniref:glycosyltransferase family 2 protein n=1 Tax=Thioalkalivibrio sp. AKL10 TaxID=1158158 RepID=UPI00035D14B8|nr:glycosyltransferase family 2 protein [Thioalkalivibrio sp. AKL10]
MRFSLIVPHYEDADRLDRLLRSVPVARDDIEVIVVDDCSPDQAALDALRVSWPGVRWCSTRENAGAGVARNVGLDAARGRWLVFADSDDEFLPGAFETFDRTLRPDDDLVYFLAEAVQEADGAPSVRSEWVNERVIEYAHSPDEEARQELCLQHIVPWAKAYSRAFVEANGVRFDPVRCGNDVAFNVLAAMRAGRLRTEVIPVYRVYRRSESLTADMSEAAFMERFRIDRSLSQRLAAMGVRRGRSATGQMLLSLRYGPGTALRVWWLAICSPMKIEWVRIFDVGRWRRFFVNQRRDAQERIK